MNAASDSDEERRMSVRPRVLLLAGFMILLAAMLVPAGIVISANAQLDVYRRQKNARAILESGGAQVVATAPGEPAWVGVLIEAEDFKRITALDLDRPLDQQNSPALEDLKFLKRLDASRAEFSDRQFVHLAKLRELEHLDLSGTAVTDNALAQLRRLTALASLNLSDTRISDVGLESLDRLHQLEYLDLSGTQVQGGKESAGFEVLIGLPSLHVLNLARCSLSADAYRHLGQLAGLRELSLAHTNTTDSDVQRLRGMVSLERLGLEETKVTDASVAFLRDLVVLKLLNLRGTSVSAAGAAQLQMALPTCRIQTGRSLRPAR